MHNGLNDRVIVESAAVFLMAGPEGLMLERLDRRETHALDGAREMFVCSATQAVRGS